MTTVPGSNAGVEGAPVQCTRDHPRRDQRSPAMKVCVPRFPKAAVPRRRSPIGARPHSRVTLVFTAVSSAGWQGIAQQCPQKQ
ncbi:hypothetical protein ROLI_034380 [Roseobacter fucihabitans]|uniref:Uncharacterized protein n=1 Tax=Roseobacter fucihabitans TaxID=1537242 RepID=A0ABZ2BWA2_9RHOB|nr:hypothetical protein [Roseobacter litoralis]